MVERYDFGRVSRLEAEAIGEPGQRRFRLILAGPAGAASLWLEKEELQALALAIERLLVQLPEEEPARKPSAPPVAEPAPAGAGVPGVEFTIGQLALGYEPSSGLIVVQFHAAERVEEAEPTLTAWGTRDQFRELSHQALAVIAAGRPRCPLCGAVLAGDHHACPRANGHLTTSET